MKNKAKDAESLEAVTHNVFYRIGGQSGESYILDNKGINAFINSVKIGQTKFK